MQKTLSFIILLFTVSFIFGQESDITKLDANYLNWQNKDLQADTVIGTSVDKLYNTVLKDMKPQKTIIVAVIDAGVDINHPDLQGKIWVNEDEIPNNNIDDDKNGYVDDIHGWNFIGNKKGENISYENLEYTRVVKAGAGANKCYADAKKLYDAEYQKRATEQLQLGNISKKYKNAKSIIYDFAKIDVNNIEDLQNIYSEDQKIIQARDFLKFVFSIGFTEKDLDEMIKQNDEFMKYYLNQNFTPRTIVGDDPLNFNDRNYGNNNVYGPTANHGTGVSGLIAANRDNGIGINGIATNVKIMAIRSTPEGDERDKDVALAIMYAVDNGADVINMSFGKRISPQKEFVDEAVKYAEKHGVLMVHSAGNDAENVDKTDFYPTYKYNDKTVAKNWITVGASSSQLDENLVANFSNYGAKSVDIFSPGVNVISTDTCNTYSMHDGTSFSGPIVAGISALILSYYPNLKPEEVIQILMESSYKVTEPKKVFLPNVSGGKRKKTSFKKLSKSGGVVNAYNAFMLAKERDK